MSRRDWKKQFLRVKQIADQNLGRAEKTEVLNEDLQLLDKRVESIQRSCTSLHRKMKEFLASAGTGADVEKKLKKMPESHLSSSLIESGTILGEETLMGSSMVLCGDTEGHMARERLQLEIDLENQVLTPIANVIEVDIPNIHKIKKHLKQHILDMDAAKARHLSAIKQQQQGNIGLGKLDSVREEMEEAQNKVDLARDQLSTEMFSLLARESDFSKILYDMITVQSQYHMRALETLNRTLPQLQEQIDCNLHTPVYGQPLEDHLTRTGREIAMVLEDCCCALINSGLDEEGLFRIAGGASKVKKLKAAFDSGMVDMDEYARDPHSVAGALKQYLRELPEPLLTYEYYNEWMRAAHLPNETRLQTLWCIVEKLPKENYNNLRYLIKFMSKLAEKSALNKMTESNIAIVLGPNLIWPPGDGGPSVLTTGTQSGIVEALISNANWFFPGDVEFSLSSSSQGSSPAGTLRGPANIDLDNPVLPYPVNPPISIAPVIAPPQASPPPPAPAISSNNNLSTESLDNNLSSVSPKAPRRTKKTAPPPPEKPSLTPAPPPATAEKPEASLYPSLPPLLTDKPSRPNAPPPSSSEPPPASPNFQDPPSPRVERPRGPPPDRPMGPPPDKPEKPPMLNNTLPRASKPMKPEKPSVSPDVLSCTDDKPPVAAKPDGPTHQRTASGSLKADSLPRGEGLGHQRLPSTGGTKPPRPQPPPPPPPRTSSSKGDEPESKESAVSTYL